MRSYVGGICLSLPEAVHGGLMRSVRPRAGNAAECLSLREYMTSLRWACAALMIMSASVFKWAIENGAVSAGNVQNNANFMPPKADGFGPPSSPHKNKEKRERCRISMHCSDARHGLRRFNV